MPYDQSNDFEFAAYKFGGSFDRSDFPSIRPGSQILMNRGNWW